MPCLKHLFSKISLSDITVSMMEELAENTENILKETASKFVFYPAALDESTDVTDTTQLCIFIEVLTKT